MIYYITDTKAEADAQEALDFVEHKAAKGDTGSKYWDSTTSWSIPRERLDGKWARSFCPHSTDEGRQTEEDDGTWFPVEEE